jgi:hypothetical protein
MIINFIHWLFPWHGGGRTRVTVIKHDWPYGDVVYQLPNGQILASRTDFFYSLTQ